MCAGADVDFWIEVGGAGNGGVMEEAEDGSAGAANVARGEPGGAARGGDNLGYVKQ